MAESALVGLPHLPIIKEREDTIAALRILNTTDLKTGNLTVYMKLIMKLLNDPIFGNA